jgi:hypothetical protein
MRRRIPASTLEILHEFEIINTLRQSCVDQGIGNGASNCLCLLRTPTSCFCLYYTNLVSMKP